MQSCLNFFKIPTSRHLRPRSWYLLDTTLNLVQITSHLHPPNLRSINKVTTNDRSSSPNMAGHAVTVGPPKRTLSRLESKFNKLISVATKFLKCFKSMANNNENSSAVCEQALSFDLFPDLPKELRLAIWDFVARQPRAVILAYEREIRMFKATRTGWITGTYFVDTLLRTVSPGPAMLYVNQEARQVGKKSISSGSQARLRCLVLLRIWSPSTPQSIRLFWRWMQVPTEPTLCSTFARDSAMTLFSTS